METNAQGVMAPLSKVEDGQYSVKLVQGRSKVVMGGMDDSVDRRIASDVVVSANSEA